MKKFLFAAIVLAGPSTVFAHGEDKLGPHGGYIRMPGGFHTEVKISGDNLSVFLLDINWKNPSIKDSSVKVEYLLNSKSSTLSCVPAKTNFSCVLTKDFNANKGALIVTAKREGMAGAAAEYPLPLKLTKYNNESDEHSKHH